MNLDLLEKIYKAGVVGSGGAGFPTHKKLNCKVEYFIINAAECEPLLQTDKYIMRHWSNQIVQAAEEIGKTVGAQEITIALKENYFREIECLRNSIKELNSRVKLFYLKGFYPAGDEQVVVYEVTGRVIPPGGIPLNVGAVVSNVGTVMNIFESMEDKSVTDKYVTVTGDVNKPSIIKAPIGTPVQECIENAGGTPNNNYCVIMGGPMMGKIFSKEDVKDKVISKTDGGIIVIPEDHNLVNRKNIPINHIINQAKSACIQCSMCTQMCPRHLLGHSLEPHKIMRAISFPRMDAEIFKGALICSECGVCEIYACPMGLSPRRVNVFLKGILREKGIKYDLPIPELKSAVDREYKLIGVPRLVMRLGLNKYLTQTVEDEAKDIQVNKVKILLKQHIGKPAASIVEKDELVQKGQLIGKVEPGDMGANIHASISGKVIDVSKEYIVIEGESCEVIS